MSQTLQSPASSLQPVRCAIYTRKSTSEGLGQEFNTLDAQREAAEFTIKSMAGEGWEVVEAHYDDGGYSGATMERPALQRLLGDIEQGLVDCVVVYKVDRLSRSLMDFAKLLEIFDKRGVSFVSTTQNFNTTSSMGRLTLNTLLSFAQFEREMIAERTRDKMGAARRRGKWLGSAPPFGYDGDRERMKLVVNEKEAEQVREIFRAYLRLETTGAVAKQINALGWERKARVVKSSGKVKGGGPWRAKHVLRLLRDPTYLGKVRYEGILYEGEQGQIVEDALFYRVQEILDSKEVGRGKRAARNPENLLVGLLWCGACRARMTTSAGTGRKKVYRYYKCSKGCGHPRVNAEELEDAVVEQLKDFCAQGELRDEVLQRVDEKSQVLMQAFLEDQRRIDREFVDLDDEQRALMETLRESRGRGSSLVMARAAELEEARERLNVQLSILQAQRKALYDGRAQVSQAAEIMSAFEEVWTDLGAEDRQDLVELLVKRVSVDLNKEHLEITFHQLGAEALEVA